jgi:hypothetical protein
VLKSSLEFPFRGDGTAKRLLVGSGLILVSLVPLVNLITGLVLNGYQMRAMRAGARDDPHPPTFDDVGDLLMDGLRFVAVALVYTVPSILVVAVGIAAVLFTVPLGTAAAGAGGVGGDALLGGTGLLATGVLLVSLVVAVVPFYFLPAALVGVATRESIGAAFELSAVATVAFSTEYLVGMVVALALVTVVGTVVQLLVLVLVGIPLVFCFQVALGHFLGRVVDRAARRNDTDVTARPAPASS